MTSNLHSNQRGLVLIDGICYRTFTSSEHFLWSNFYVKYILHPCKDKICLIFERVCVQLNTHMLFIASKEASHRHKINGTIHFLVWQHQYICQFSSLIGQHKSIWNTHAKKSAQANKDHTSIRFIDDTWGPYMSIRTTHVIMNHARQ